MTLPQFPFVVDKYPPPVSPPYRYYCFIAHEQWKQLYHQYSEQRPLTAAIRKATDPTFYAKSAYMAMHGGLQAMRRMRQEPQST